MSAIRPAISLAEFEASKVDAATFDHEAHVYVAWLYLGSFDTGVAIDRFNAALKRLTQKLGVPGKYHATISWFYMLLIAERRQRQASPGDDWTAFKSANQDLVSGNSELLGRYYSRERLASSEARQRFLLPDRNCNEAEA